MAIEIDSITSKAHFAAESTYKKDMRMMYYLVMTQANSEKEIPSAPIRSRTLDLPITGADYWFVYKRRVSLGRDTLMRLARARIDAFGDSRLSIDLREKYEGKKTLLFAV